jgi:ribosomal protein S18 acetylase RimI-like enzyme
MEPADVTIRTGSLADVDALERLWVAVHHRHAEAMPELGPYVSDAETWAARSALYRRLLARPGTTLLLAERDGELVAYGLAYILDPDEDWVRDTWATGARIGEIESLSVRPADRGQGLGTLLLERLERALADQGVQDLVIGLLPGNDGALRLYERRGYRPTWMYVSRFASRDG